MNEIREELVLAIHNAEFMCRFENGCRTGKDCYNCELLSRDCTKGYVADKLMEKFNISVKDGDNE